MKRKLLSLVFIVIAVTMLVSACAPASTPTSEPVQPTMAEATAAPVATEAPALPTEAPVPPTEAAPTTANMLPAVDPSALTGDIYTAGSSTVYPLSEKLAEMFQNDGFAGNLKIDSIGTGAGFERFCKTGESDISNASRKIKDSEVENCKAINRIPVEFRVGTDAIAIVVSSENDFLTDVTLEELANIFSGSSEKWSDINPAYPAEPIQRFVPGTDSGTFDYFVEAVMVPVFGGEKKDVDVSKEAFLSAKNLSQSEDDNVLVQGVEGSKYAIGFFGYAYFSENQGALKALSVNGVSPDATTAEDGTYKISRPLFIYSDAGILKSKPEVAGFINYYLTNVNSIVTEVGYFPASDDAIMASMQNWLDATK